MANWTDTLKDAIPAIAALAPIIAAVLVFKVNKKNAQTQSEKQKDEFEQATWKMGNELMSRMDEKLKDNESKIKNLNSVILQLQKENKELQDELLQFQHKYRAFETAMLHKLEMLESAHSDLPIPQWLKDDSGRMLFFNRAYERTFLNPRGYEAKDYKGKMDSDVWPEDIAKEFYRNDMHVLTADKPWVGEETIENAEGERVKWRILKYSRKSGRHIIGVAGIAFPESYEDMFSHLTEQQIDDIEQGEL